MVCYQSWYRKKCTDGLAKSNVKFTVFDIVVPNCPDRLIMMGYNLYKHSKCDGIIAVGGGSSMDCAKVIGAKVANPSEPIESFIGSFKVSGRDPKREAKFPPFIAIPTTAGTGLNDSSSSSSFRRTWIKRSYYGSSICSKYGIGC